MTLYEFINNASSILRGMLLRTRLNGCGSLLRCEKGVRVLKKNGEIRLGNRVFLHRNAKLSAYGAEGRAIISIGDKSYVGDGTEIHAGERVEIGNGVLIACGCTILDRDYHKFESDKERVKPIVIKDHVWICANCTILKGVTIGEGAVVAAGSVVTRSVPARALAAGNPARVIKENVNWEN